MVSSSVQFRGLDSVLEAFQNRDVPAWSLWQGKQFMFKCDGEAMPESIAQLDTILQTLAKSSNAIYTLKVYEDLPKGGKIKSNTPDDGSFNFKLNFEGQEITANQYSTVRNQEGIEKRLGAIEQMLQREEEEEEPEPRKNNLGIIGDILNDPGISALVVPLITKFLGIGATPAQLPQMAINGVGDEAQLQSAINILKDADPKLTEHLTKLASMAQEQRASFDFLLKTLDNL